MSNKIKKVVQETLVGVGKVFQNADLLSTVRYTIKVEQEIHLSETMSGVSETSGHSHITAQLELVEGERDLVNGEILTLRLEDGREWLFFARSGNPISGRFAATNAAPQGLKKKAK